MMNSNNKGTEVNTKQSQKKEEIFNKLFLINSIVQTQIYSENMINHKSHIFMVFCRWDHQSPEKTSFPYGSSHRSMHAM